MFLLVAVGALFGTDAQSDATPAAPGPGWIVSSVAHPTNFSTGDNALCMKEVEFFCDEYVVTITNVGEAATTGPVAVVDTLPAGLRVLKMKGLNLEDEASFQSNGPLWTCQRSTVTCIYHGTAQAGTTLAMFVEVEVTSGAGAITNSVRVSGGGAPAVSTSEPLTLPNTVNEGVAPFGLAALGFEAHDEAGSLDTQAADHPASLTDTFGLTTAVKHLPNGAFEPAAVGTPKNVAVYLPVGFIGDPNAAAQCTERQFKLGSGQHTECPLASRVGRVVFFTENSIEASFIPLDEGGYTTALYNLGPSHGFPARFGFKVLNVPVTLYISLVHTPAGYMLRVEAPGLPTTIHVEGVELTFYGDPKATDGELTAAQSFFTNPDDCDAGPITSRIQVDSWENPAAWISGETTAYPQITGCNMLQFEPTVEVHPEVTQSEAPTGAKIKIKVPQAEEQFPILATPQLKDVTLSMPEGMTISPGGGSGLVGCEATGPNGIDMPTDLPGGEQRTPVQAGEGEAIGQEGMTQLVAGHCPDASRIGTVKITTPVLKEQLEGHLYIAQPRCGGAGQAECTAADAASGNLFGLYLEAGSEELGSVVKLRGSVSVDPATGRITARFLENPQLPVSEVAIQLKGGPRAPLANPRQCGPASANADLAPWSAPVTPDALISSPTYQVDWNGAREQCPGAVPFAPSLVAGPTNAVAGRFSPFTFTLTRGDRQQDIARVQEHMPVGLLGTLANVQQCGEPQASQGDCPQDSRIGTVNVAAGSGSTPLWVQGRVYLTGPYAGAPFGLSIVVPAIAGPFNLGNVIVRSRIDIDPNTSALTVTSDPLPQFRDGVPLRIQTLNITIDRPGFTFNPTNCQAKQVAVSAESTQGAVANLASPVALEGCSGLPFKPGFKVSTQAKTSKANGASLTVRVTSGAGQANIGKVDLQLPKALPARLTTLQKACTEAQFNANPAGCPAASVIGSAKAITPVLNVPLTGPAYLVSHGGAAFPDVEFILQGQGVRIDLDGKTQIKKGITYSRFETVPDAPISSFETVLPQGPHSVLATNLPLKAKGSLCGTKLVIPTTLTGQNGAVLTQSTKVAVSGCVKAAKVAKVKKKANNGRSLKTASHHKTAKGSR
ncbi:MAG TPA: hypothetical protein VGH60_07020 [Solirubrobacteraceae bacterium]